MKNKITVMGDAKVETTVVASVISSVGAVTVSFEKKKTDTKVSLIAGLGPAVRPGCL